MKHRELFKERYGKIIFTTEFQRIPFVRPPTFMAVDRKRNFGLKHRNNTLFTKIALAFIQRTLVPPYEPARKTALPTPRRRRDAYFFIEIEILRFDDELTFTILARFILSHGFCPPEADPPSEDNSGTVFPYLEVYETLRKKKTTDVLHLPLIC